MLGAFLRRAAPQAKVAWRAAGISTSSRVSNTLFDSSLSNGASGILVKELNTLKCKTYLVADFESRKALLIDPLRHRVPLYISTLAYHGLRLEYAIDTHTHADHASGLHELKNLIGCTTIMHKTAPTPRIDRHVDQGDTIKLGKYTVELMHTPGHTPDCISIYLPDAGIVFPGDALLIRGTGRTDFAGGDAAQSYHSVVDRLFKLPRDTVVLPGHDYKGKERTTIGEEIDENPRVGKGTTVEGYTKLMGELFSIKNLPDRIHDVLQMNQAGLHDHHMDAFQMPKLGELTQIPQAPVMEVIGRLSHDDPPPILLDIREPCEIAEDGRVAGSKHVLFNDLVQYCVDNKLGATPDHPIVVLCRSGIRSNSAAAMLRNHNFRNVANMEGGILEWKERGLPVEFPEKAAATA
eukprot:Clim_evm119s157 gene=Clim_evmTU119s157